MNHDPKLGTPRQKVRTFMDLPYHERRARAFALGVFEEGDDSVRGDEIDILWVRRAKAKGCVEKLLTGVGAEEQTRPTPPTGVCGGTHIHYMQRLPGGLCFAHGPYTKGMNCPQWPKCITDPQKPEYLAMSMKRVRAGATPEPPTPAKCPTCTSATKDHTTRWLPSAELQATVATKCPDPWHTEGEAVTSSGAQPPAGIYVASRASIPERSEMWRSLRQGGIKINATWIDEAEENATQSFSELWSRIEREIKSSTGLVLYAEPDDFPLKGALIEVGMALAFGLPVVICAPSVQMSPRNFKPLGSWAKHPLVTFEKSLEIACRVAGRRATQGSSPAPEPVNREEEFRRIIAAPGTPSNPSQRLPAALYGHYKAGDSVAELTADYNLPREQIHWGIRIGYLLEQIGAQGSSVSATPESGKK